MVSEEAYDVALAATSDTEPDYVLPQGTFVETVTAIAFDAKLEPTAIPSIAIGYRPKVTNKHWKWFGGGGFELLFGGALNSASGDGGDVDLAIGGGVSFPIGESASLALGYIRWNPSGGEVDDGLYIGITFGPKAQKK